MQKATSPGKDIMDAGQCTSRLSAIDDTLYVVGGKWKLKIIIAISEKGSIRFNELQRTIAGISARVLSNELKEMEMNGFIKRKVQSTSPVLIESELTGYSNTLGDVLQAMVDWGTKHRKKIRADAKRDRMSAVK
jgi:DNA-binding HxlR family transcriptional regulator